MSDIVERLRKFVTGCDKPECQRMIFTPLVCEEAAAEIERLRAGGCARDQSTTQYCAEAAKLAAEVERLRAALEKMQRSRDRYRQAWEAEKARARAALIAGLKAGASR